MAKFAKIIKENKESFLIKKFIRLFREKIKNKGNKRFSFVLAGGLGPIKLYKNLAKEKNINWKKIDFFISDERYVKDTSQNSNIKMCKKYFLDKIKISNDQIYKISTNIKPVYKCTINYEKKIKGYFSNRKICFDLILLGMGNDGHIASLFKKNINKKTDKNVNFVKRNDFVRITLTLKCLNNSRSIFLWVPNKSKINIVRKILQDNKFDYPVSFLKGKNNFLFHCN